MPKSSAYLNLPESLAAFRAASNSSAVHGCSSVGVRRLRASSVDWRVTSAMAASHRPIEYSLPLYMPLVPGRKLAILLSSIVSGCI